MPDAPDFDQIARHICVFMLGLTTDPLVETERNQTIAKVAGELRLVWNARGAADCAKLVEVMDELDHPEILGRSLRSLDR